MKSLGYFFYIRQWRPASKGRRRQALWKFSKAKIVSSGLLWCCSQRQESFEKTFFNPSWFRKMLCQNYLSRRLLLKSYLIFLWKKVSHGMAIKFIIHIFIRIGKSKINFFNEEIQREILNFPTSDFCWISLFAR